MKVDLFVLNYNGAEYISECMNSLSEAVKHSAHDCRLFMIDNSSADESISIIQKKFPNIKILPMENRLLCSFNVATAQSQADVVFLLNNDLKADPAFIDPVISIFEKNKDAFLVTSKSFLFDGSYEGGLSTAFMSLGFFGTACRFPGFEERINNVGITFAGGFGAFDRKRFLELGGYDDLYLPGRMEDADLMFRAWKKGWKCYFQPKSILYHMGAKSFNQKYGVRGTMEIALRNTFLFMWKNINSPEYWLAHFFFLAPRMIWMLAKGHSELITAFVKALRRLRQAFSRRQREKTVTYQYSDREVFSFFSHGR